MGITKKLLKLNKQETVGISIPKKLAIKLGWSCNDFVNISFSGNTLHITKVKVE